MEGGGWVGGVGLCEGAGVKLGISCLVFLDIPGSC